MVFQDPFASFDPLSPVAGSVSEPLRAAGVTDHASIRARLLELVELVQLRPEHLDRYPTELSGGQLQRLGIARALSTSPSVVVLDEPVSSLDVSTQAQILNLLSDLQRDLGVSYLLIAHNPALVRHASHRIAVMYLGEVVELGDADAVFDRPRHPYTDALLSAVLVPNPAIQRSRRSIRLQGELSVANATSPPSGCRFHPRCPHVMDICRTVAPPPFSAPDGVVVHCHLHEHGPKLRGTPVSILGVGARQQGSGAADRAMSEGASADS
jgi:peptide/nickel transport system ATP-binding protein